ncbi:MAG: cytochrome c [Trueperaceae bacterium]
MIGEAMISLRKSLRFAGVHESSVAVVVALLLALLLVSCGPVFDRPVVTGSLAGSDPELLLGERVFYANCHGCHPQGGRGLGRGVTDRPLPDFAVRLQIRNGFGEMPGFSEAEIDEAELDALLAYLHELRRRWASEGS